MRPRSTLVRRRPALVAVTAAAIALSLAGCDLMTAKITPRPSRFVSTPEPVPSPTATEIEEAPTLRPDPSGSGPDLVDAANGLADLDSYRVTVVARGLVPATPANGPVTMTSTLVQGSQPAAQFTMTGVDGFAGGRLQAIVIGDQAWLKEGGGLWKKSPGGAADFDAAFTTLSPIELVIEFEGLGGAIRRTGVETRNGRRTIHYRADAGDAVAAEAGLSKGAVDAWFAATGGYLVSLQIDGTWDLAGTPTRVVLRIDVTRVNDPSNRVRPPI
jgi:hypothetical protein